MPSAINQRSPLALAALLSAPCLAQPVTDDPEVIFPGHPGAPGAPSGGAPGSPPIVQPAPVSPAPPCCVFDPLPPLSPQPQPVGPGPIEPAASPE